MSYYAFQAKDERYKAGEVFTRKDGRDKLVYDSLLEARLAFHWFIPPIETEKDQLWEVETEEAKTNFEFLPRTLQAKSFTPIKKITHIHLTKNDMVWMMAKALEAFSLHIKDTLDPRIRKWLDTKDGKVLLTNPPKSKKKKGKKKEEITLLRRFSASFILMVQSSDESFKMLHNYSNMMLLPTFLFHANIHHKWYPTLDDLEDWLDR